MIVCDIPYVANWVAERTTADPRCTVAAIGWERDGQLICGAFYEQYTGTSVTATIALEPGSVLPREFLKAIFELPFKAMECIKIIALVAEDNWKSQRFVEHLGFVLETSVADYYPTGKLLVYAMNKHDCRYLESENG